MKRIWNTKSLFVISQILLITLATLLVSVQGQTKTPGPNSETDTPLSDNSKEKGEERAERNSSQATESEQNAQKQNETLQPLTRVGCVLNVRDTPTGNPNDNVDNFNFEYCTDLYYYEAFLDENTYEVKTLFSGETRPEISNGLKPLFQKFNEIKTLDNHERIRTFLVVGLKDKASKAFESVARNQERTNTFVWSVIRTLRFWGFNGLAVNWRHSNAENRDSYTSLITRIREEFAKEDGLTDLDHLLLVAFVGAPTRKIRQLYDVDVISANTHQLNVDVVDDLDITYSKTAILNALYIPDLDNLTTPSSRKTRDVDRHDTDTDSTQVDALEAKLKEWVWLGANPTFINVVFSLTGNSYKLQDASKHDIGDPAVGQYKPDSKKINGTSDLPFSEICRMVELGGNLRRLSARDKTPYWYDGQVWINFEDEVSLRQKVMYLRRNRISGAILFSQSQDDILGINCGRGHFPMVTALYNASSVKSFHHGSLGYEPLVCTLQSDGAVSGEVAPFWIIVSSTSLALLWVAFVHFD